jgi:ornithine carbamoyltransferase
MSFRGRDLITIGDLDAGQVSAILDRGLDVKARPERYRSALQGATLAMIFQKPSLRTRVTFETGMTQLGGHGIYISPTDSSLGVRESVADVARNLERWVDGIIARVFAHSIVEDLARHAGVPVVNALSDDFHPCQALGDALTLREHFGELKGLRLAYVGDGNNMAHSLMLVGSRCGMHVSIATPAKHAPRRDVVDAAAGYAGETGASIQVGADPRAAVRDADAVYTDVWASMGQESEASERDAIFRPFQVNAALMKAAGPKARFMHCLPAHRGDEVTDEVADSPASVIFDQAENRLHIQKAILSLLMAD